MKTSTRITLIYGLSGLTVGGVAYYRGKRGMDLGKDIIWYGLAVGTSSVIVSFISSNGASKAVSNPGLGFFPKLIANASALSKGGATLLSQIDPDTLYASMKSQGVKIAPVPSDSSIVVQDEK